MDDALVLDGLIGDVYDAAMQPEHWPAIVERITRWIEGDTCHLAGWNPGSGQTFIRCMFGLQLEVGDEYSRHHAANDPRLGLAMSLGTGALIRCHEHFDRNFVSRSEFYQDYLLPIGVHYLLGSGNLSTDPDSIVVVGFQRHVGHGAFEDVQYQRIARLLPHPRRSVSIMQKTSGYREAAKLGAGLQDRLDQSVFALDESGGIAFANAKGHVLLRQQSPFRSIGGRLRAIGVHEAKLASAIDRARVTGVPQSLKLPAVAGGGERIMQYLPKSDYFVNVVRIGREGGGGEHLSRAAKVIVFAQSIAERRVASAEQLVSYFCLTPAEARLAHALAQGTTLDNYATHAKVAISTVRSQLRAVLAKTHTARLQDLLLLLARLSPT